MFAALLAVDAGIDPLTQWWYRLASDPIFVPLMPAVERLTLYLDIGLPLWWAVVSAYDAIVELRAD